MTYISATNLKTEWFSSQSDETPSQKKGRLARFEAAQEKLKVDAKDKILATYFETLPYAYAGTKLDRIPSSEAVEAIRAWCQRDDDGRGLGLIGPTGVGKSRAIFKAIQWEMLRCLSLNPITAESHSYAIIEGISVGTISCGSEISRLVRQRTDFKDKNHQWANRMLPKISCCDLLLLDDLGVGKLSEAVTAEIYDIVEARTANDVPILFTSNYRGEGLANRFADPGAGAAIVRRLREFCDITNCTVDVRS
jgi:DNA replication protein DnaC